MFGWGLDIGIDLGTATVLIYRKGQGIILQEPSVVALDTNTGEIRAIGEEARLMIGRTPGSIVAVRPLREGVIADFDVTERMIRYFIAKSCGRRMLFKPRIMVCVPSGVTSVEQRAVKEAAMQAGAKQVFLIEEPLAAALGVGIDISLPSGSMVVDIGGGTTDIAVLSLGGIVISDSVRIGGDKFDQAIIRYVKDQYKVLIGERTAEEIKIEVGTAYPEEDEQRSIEVRGRNLVTGLPKSITIDSEECFKALKSPLNGIMATVRGVLERTPPEIAADIIDKGIFLTGGGALLRGLDKFFSSVTQIPIHVADDPVSRVALGAGMALEQLDKLAPHLLANDKKR